MRDLGFAIIILTILIRLVLLVPSQRAIISQRRMQELQPKLNRIKKNLRKSGTDCCRNNETLERTQS